MMKCRRLFAALVAIMMVVSMLGVTAYAEENEGVYVLAYNSSADDFNGHRYSYFSPYRPNFKIENQDAQTTWSVMFNLYDTINKEAIPTYCTDLETGINDDATYRRINLEDSTYAGVGAGVLRAIVNKGFPNTTAAALGEAAGVEGLTVGEALAATQAAVWKIANGSERVDFIDFYRAYDPDWSETIDHYAECNEEIASGYADMDNKETIVAHIEKAFDYLIHLDPMAPSGVVASENSFKAWNAEYVDGVYTVTATVDVTLNSGDALALTASVGEVEQTKEIISGSNEYTFTFENVAQDETVMLAISGTQAAKDVYLFDAVGVRGTSQSLIGITDNNLPVYAEVNANDRVVNILKTDKNKVGLQNITFDFYYVCSVNDYLTGRVTIGTGIEVVTDAEGNTKEYFSKPTEADIAKYVNEDGAPEISITTDANGWATHNFGTDNDGIYIVVERENAVTTGAINPFFLAVPGGAYADGIPANDEDIYNITIQPKNDVIEEDIIIEKDVNKIDNNHDTHDVGEVHTWIIQTSIPAGLATGLKYEITDTLNYQLTFKGNVIVTVSEMAAAAHDDLLVLDEDVDYILTVTPGVDEEDRDNTTFKVALTASGMEKVAAVKGEAPEVRVYFDAIIDEDAILGTEIPNQAHISYENNVGVDFDADSDIPEVHTGGINLVKVDASNGQKLAGAKFTLNVLNEDGTYTPVAFYNNAAMTGEKVTEVVTDANGNAVFYGLAYGTYYLIETESPEGYNLLSEPVAVPVNAVTHLTENAVTVKNSAEFRLPETGGIGTAVFTFGGAGIIGAAALVLLGGKKKKA